MAIRKTNDIANETNSKYDNVKSTAKRANIQERFDDTTENDNPYDDAIQYLAKKIDDVIDETNSQTTASGSLDTKIKAITSFPGFGTTSTTALRGNTTTITSDQASAITANTAKTDGRYIYFPIVANFSGNINTEQYIPLSDGETEGTNALQRRNIFIAPCTGTIYKVFVRSNASLQSRGGGVTLTGKMTKYVDGNDSKANIISTTVTTAATAVTNILDFSSVSNNSFAAGDRLLVSLQAGLDATKNYYVTVLFKLDQNGI